MDIFSLITENTKIYSSSFKNLNDYVNIKTNTHHYPNRINQKSLNDCSISIIIQNPPYTYQIFIMKLYMEFKHL